MLTWKREATHFGCYYGKSNYFEKQKKDNFTFFSNNGKEDSNLVTVLQVSGERSLSSPINCVFHYLVFLT